MSKVTFELNAQKRVDVGKGASRRLRREAKLVPAILYGAEKENLPLMLEHHKVLHALENEAIYSHVLTLIIDEKQKEKVVLKALQRHPYKKQILHMDFLRIRADEQLYIKVPLHFIGEDEAPGIKQKGIFTKHITEIEVRCLPKDLPEYLEIDVSNLELGHILHLSDIKLPKGIEIVALLHDDKEADIAVVNIHEPRAAVEEEPAETPAETEITGQKSETEEAQPEKK